MQESRNWGHHGSRLMPGGGLGFWRAYSWQGGGGGSRGQGGWDEVLVDFRGHHSCPKVFGLALAKGWLHVEIKKGMKEDEREKRHEQEAFDGSGVMLQYMIGVPTLDQLILKPWFSMSHRWCPKPTARSTGTRPDGSVVTHTQSLVWNSSFLSLLIELTPYRIGLQRTNDPYGILHLRPGDQVAKIPPPAITRSKGSLNWRHGIEQPGGILIEVPAFILEDHQRVFTVCQQEVEEGGAGIERVSQH